MKMEAKVIKEKDPGFDFSKPEKRTVLLCTNGFQNADIHDSTAMKEYFEKNFGEDFSNCMVVPVQLFLPADPKTHHAHLYEKILEEKIEEYERQDADIVLMGYSFSAALSAKLQHRHPKIQKLILVAPVYDTIVNNMIVGYIQYVLKFHRLSKKYGPAIAKAMGRETTKGMIGLLLSILHSVLSCRGSYRKVTCDTLIIHGEEDELSTPHSLKKIRSRMKARSLLYVYPGMNHGILKTVRDNGIVFEDILSYAFGTPHLLSTTIEQAPEKKEKVALDEDGNPIPTFQEIFAELDPDYEKERKEDQGAV